MWRNQRERMEDEEFDTIGFKTRNDLQSADFRIRISQSLNYSALRASLKPFYHSC